MLLCPTTGPLGTEQMVRIRGVVPVNNGNLEQEFLLFELKNGSKKKSFGLLYRGTTDAAMDMC
jgi:hypothetical protein